MSALAKPPRSPAKINAEIRRVVNKLGALRLERAASLRLERRALRASQPKAVRWHGEQLERLRAAYESGRLLRLIARDFGTSPGCVANLAYQHGWRRKLLKLHARAFVAPRGDHQVERTAVGSP